MTDDAACGLIMVGAEFGFAVAAITHHWIPDLLFVVGVGIISAIGFIWVIAVTAD